MPVMALSPSFDSQCPSCNKQFATDSDVLRHMNHPSTSCMTWFDCLESTLHLNGSNGQPPTNQWNHDEMDRDDRTTHNTEVAHDSSMEYEELHPNVPLVIGYGPGFIDIFNADQHAEKRRDNLYYPFSSKGEWGLASWLLCSGLSMRAIDDFLALPIVSPEPVQSNPNPPLIKTRFNNFHSPSQLQKRYVLEWRTFPRHPPGKHNLSLSLATPPQNP